MSDTHTGRQAGRERSEALGRDTEARDPASSKPQRRPSCDDQGKPAKELDGRTSRPSHVDLQCARCLRPRQMNTQYLHQRQDKLHTYVTHDMCGNCGNVGCPLHTHHRCVCDDAVSEREGLLCVLVTEHRDRHVGCSGCGREKHGSRTVRSTATDTVLTPRCLHPRPSGSREEKRNRSGGTAAARPYTEQQSYWRNRCSLSATHASKQLWFRREFGQGRFRHCLVRHCKSGARKKSHIFCKDG